MAYVRKWEYYESEMVSKLLLKKSRKGERKILRVLS